MKKILVTLSFIALVLIGLWFFLFFMYPTTSSLNSAHYFVNHLRTPHKEMRQEVFGFMPYWRTADIDTIRSDIVSEVDYFALSINTDGTFKTITSNQTDPGWYEWNSQKVKDFIAQTQIMGGKFSFTVMSQNNDDIESLLQSQRAQSTLIAQINQQITARHLNGINVDIEYQGTADDQLRNSFTTFAQTLTTTIHQNNPQTILSLSIMPSETNGDGLFDLAKLSPLFDRFIGMSYDFYGVSSANAGPVAPMHGFKEKKYFFDVTTMYQNLTKLLPANKIIMGIPYYGWDWAVENGATIQSPTLPSSDPNSYAVVISYARAKTDKDLQSNQCQWDDYAEAHWCWYTDANGTDHQVWYENNKSLGIKFDYAKQQQFSGVAIWVLGYDKGYQDLWNILLNRFSQ